jgi:uncharacterized protein DUF6680
MALSDWLTVAAILLAPLVALRVSMWLDRRKEKAQRKFRIFQTLMATRASGLAPEHVQALNMIDVEFYGTSSGTRAVVDAWKVYLDFLNTPAAPSEAWGARREELLVDILQKMARHLGYYFDKTDIKRTSYFPQGYGTAEWEQQQIRQLMLALLKGERSLPVSGAPPSGGTALPPHT